MYIIICVEERKRENERYMCILVYNLRVLLDITNVILNKKINCIDTLNSVPIIFKMDFVILQLLYMFCVKRNVFPIFNIIINIMFLCQYVRT